jgi:hypothetical protein
MSTAAAVSATPKWMFWTGWVLSLLPAPLLAMSGIMKILNPPQLAEGFTHLGWPADLALALAVLELGSLILYLIPQTAVLGAILLTGYLGGAIATHVRIGEGWIGPALFGVVLWLGLFLRDPRIRELLPIRRTMKVS